MPGHGVASKKYLGIYTVLLLDSFKQAASIIIAI